MNEQINGLTNSDIKLSEKISEDGMKIEIDNLKKSFEPIQHGSLLNSLLNEIKPIDFREKSGLDGESKSLSKKHYLVVCIDEILEIANKKKWGICRNNGFIYLYNGCYWSFIENNEMGIFLGEAAEKMGIDKFDARYFSFKENLFNQFLTASNLSKPITSKDTVLINLQNGTFEISPTRQALREPRREDFLKYQLPFSFDKTATAPIFQKFLNQVLPEIEKQMILAEFFGFIFIKNTVLKLEKALLLYGKGANGKSVIFDIIYALLGGSQNVGSFGIANLTEKSGLYRAQLANKLLNYASEISGNLQASVFKQLVSGEPVEAKVLYVDPFLMTDYAKLIFNCNELPIAPEQTHGFFRRFTILPFDVRIDEKDYDRELSRKIIENELSGVFNWILDGLQRLLLNKGLTHCDSVVNQLENYKKQSDTVQVFLDEEHFVKSNDENVPLKHLYLLYRSYCSESGDKASNRKTFTERLRNINISIVRKAYGMAVYVKKND